jgi:major capsid protein E
MNPTPGDVHVNAPLTNLSIAYIQSNDNFIAARVFPNIPVSKQSDRYYTYERGDFNRDEMQERAPGTESVGSGYNVDNTPTYYCRVYAFHRDVPDQMRANADAALNPDREAMIFVTQKALIKREKVWTNTYFKPGVWAFEKTGVAANPNGTQKLRWDDAASTPIEDVSDAKRAMMEETGFEPNKLTLGRAVYDKLRNHPDIVDRIKYGQTAVGDRSPAKVNRQTLASLFEVDEILVCNAIENTAAEGAAPVHTFIGGKHALLTYAPAEAGLMTPSAGYTFSWTGYLGAGNEGTRIKTFRMENLESDRVEIQAAFASKLVGTDLGYFFATIVG